MSTTCRHCDRPVKYRRHGLCSAHGNRLRRYGVAVGCKVDGCDGSYYQSGLCRTHKHPRCDVESCSRRASCRGLCAAHYQRQARTGSTHADVPVGRLGKPRAPRWDRCVECGAESWAGGRWCHGCVHAALDAA